MTEPHYADDSVTLYHGNCLDVMRSMPAESVDAIVTDPPYGLGFMGKAWDALPPGREWADEALRVLKPGGHVLAFGGTRTWHRLAVAVEDAGFELRDSIAWLYGSGFPKSLDVSKAIDKRGGTVAEFGPFRDACRAAMQRLGIRPKDVRAALGNDMAGHYLTAGSQPAVPNLRDYGILRDLLQLGDAFDSLFIAEADREVVGTKAGNLLAVAPGQGEDRGAVDLDVTVPATDAAQQWAGWGTALKPAFEPIVVGRKPLVGTVAANVLQHGVGALNIDACRTAFADDADEAESKGKNQHADFGTKPGGNAVYGDYSMVEAKNYNPPGRWPTNVALDDDQAAELGDTARFFPTFKYQAKAPARERPKVNGVAHPTVKPLDLMRWLVRLVTPPDGLVTPPDGLVLEPFAGSGTTIEACQREGFRCVAIEQDADYLPLIESRLLPPWERAA